MPKDIMIDSCCIMYCFGQINNYYEELFEWLTNTQVSSKLMLSQKLYIEYIGGNNNLSIFIDDLIRKGKILPIIDNKEIKNFRSKYFSKKVKKKLESNKKDWDHIALVMISNRKLALSGDKKLNKDINNFPKFRGQGEECPSKLAYK